MMLENGKGRSTFLFWPSENTVSLKIFWKFNNFFVILFFKSEYFYTG